MIDGCKCTTDIRYQSHPERYDVCQKFQVQGWFVYPAQTEPVKLCVSEANQVIWLSDNRFVTIGHQHIGVWEIESERRTIEHSCPGEIQIKLVQKLGGIQEKWTPDMTCTCGQLENETVQIPKECPITGKYHYTGIRCCKKRFKECQSLSKRNEQFCALRLNDSHIITGNTHGEVFIWNTDTGYSQVLLSKTDLKQSIIIQLGINHDGTIIVARVITVADAIGSSPESAVALTANSGVCGTAMESPIFKLVMADDEMAIRKLLGQQPALRYVKNKAGLTPQELACERDRRTAARAFTEKVEVENLKTIVWRLDRELVKGVVQSEGKGEGCGGGGGSIFE